MKIGLLSYHHNYNYGWNLQCYALMATLKSLGHDVTYIDKRKFSDCKLITKKLKKLIRRLLEAIHLINRSMSYEEFQMKKGALTMSFFYERITPRTRPIFSETGLKKLEKFEAVIVGSDQCWRPKLVNPISSYFLDFINYPCKKISYAASFGTGDAEYSDHDIKVCGKLIKKFDAVSVREKEGINLLKEKYRWDCSPILVPDPTFLLEESNYLDIIPKDLLNSNSNIIFAYILDKNEDKDKCIEKLSSSIGLEPEVIYLNPESLVPIPSVETWLSKFVNAKFVFTDSFHGAVFSILFKKPFIVYANKQRGLSRFVTLLDMFSLDNRLIFSYDELTRTLINDAAFIDIEAITRMHKSIRSKGIEFIKLNLNKQ